MIEMFSILVVVVFFIKASVGIIKETKVFEFVVNSKVLFLGRTFLGSAGSFLSFGFGNVEFIEVRIPLLLFFYFVPFVNFFNTIFFIIFFVTFFGRSFSTLLRSYLIIN